MDLRMTADLAGILQKAQKAGYLTLLASRGVLAAGEPEGLEGVCAAFESAGLDTAALRAGSVGVGLWLLGPNGPEQQLWGRMGEELALARAFGPAGGPQAELAARANGHTLSIRLNGEELALDHDGISVVVADPVTGRLVQNICFDSADGYAPYTD